MKDTEGVIVTDISPEGVAVDSGIKTGDIIKKINGQKVLNLDDYNTAVSRIKNKSSVVFLIKHGKYSTYVIIKR